MELKKYKLADIAKIEISGVDKKTMDGEIPVRLCNFVDVYYNWAITKEKAKSFMVASAKQTEIDKCSIGKDMVAITKDSETRDDIGIATYIADDFEDVLLGYHCALITPNPAIVDGKYLNAFMHTRYIQKYFENNASGSGQRYTLSNDTISNIPVLLPSIEEQHTIGKLLADLDRKIELNKQINYHLSVVNVVARLPFYRRLPIFMYCFILLLLSRLSWYNKNVRLQEVGDVVKGVIKEVALKWIATCYDRD